MTSESPACDICDSRHITKPSTSWCFQCNEGLCEECKEHHTLNKASKSHCIIPVSEFQKLPVSVLQLAESCKLHSERYQVYCHKHESSCCTKCLIEDHKNCKDLTDINDVVRNIKSSNMLLEIETSMREVAENLQKIQKNREGNLSSLKQNRQMIEKEIQTARQTINEHFNSLERELLKELQTIENDERKKLSKMLASVERKAKKIDELQISLAIIKQHASDLQTFLVSKHIENELMETESQVQSMQENNELSHVNISLQKDDLIKTLNENISRFGRIVVQTSQSEMSLKRQKIEQAQAKVAAVIAGSPEHQYDTIKTEEDPCFIVTVRQSEAVRKFGLNGRYRLRLTSSCFILEDIEKITSKCCWPYGIVRSLGPTGIKKELTITVGRRNVLGEGTVGFMCSSGTDPDKIIRLFKIIIERIQSDLKH
ncbi:E3 ubiquitin-protein ligase TRIM71-like [Mytilus trossulus]|uniref:E3 ubiquitin-protein ligase TRIM71-like n=1 Tax=Mytilus trossulus TaxID=6551 RepID=UPI0030073691